MSEFVAKKICSVWPGDAWSSNLLSSASRASSNIYWSCALQQPNQWNCMSMAFSALGRILLVSSACAVKLLVWMGVRDCECPISLSVLHMDTAVLALTNSAPSLASAANDITALIICEIFNTALLFMGISSVPAMNIWPPALLLAFGSKR
jgi:hypothetical protein